MKYLVLSNDKWYTDDEVSNKWVTMMQLPDFRGYIRECWHLRGRGWRWLIIKSDFINLEDKEYVLAFWGKIDYYSRSFTRCFIAIHETWDDGMMFDINPNCPYAVASAGGWYLYKIPIKLIHGSNLRVELIAFEANIAIIPASPEDEDETLVYKGQGANEGKAYYINEEVPYREYNYLEQRMVKYYSDLLAPYYPTQDIQEACQLEYYNFVKELYHRLYTRPEEFFTKLNGDDAFPNRFNCSEYGKPELKPNMKKARDKIEELFRVLLTLGTTAEEVEGGLLLKSSPSKKHMTMLTYMGFDIADDILRHKIYPNLHQAVKYSTGMERPLLLLQLGWFNSAYNYLEKTHEKFYDRDQYRRLIDWLYERGYQSSIGFGSTMTLDYTKSISKKDKPVGYALFGDKYHYGFTFEFRPEPRVMQHCGIRIILFSEILKRFDELSERSRRLIQQRTKPCDGCRFCVQTDKTGKRKLATIRLSDGTGRCPYFPGSYYTYERLTGDDVDDILAFLTDFEQVILDNQVFK